MSRGIYSIYGCAGSRRGIVISLSRRSAGQAEKVTPQLMHINLIRATIAARGMSATG